MGVNLRERLEDRSITVTNATYHLTVGPLRRVIAITMFIFPHSREVIMRAVHVSTIALCTMAAMAAGCTSSWEPQYGPAPQVAAAQTGRTVRVITRDRGAVELRNVQVIDDSIVGDAGDPPQRVAIATSNVQVITVRRSNHSTANTAIIVGGATLVALTALAVIWFDDLFDFDWN